MGTIVVIYLAIIALILVSMWKIYTKAGKPGWACLIPIYNIIVLLEIVGKPWWWLLLMIIPVVNIVFVIWMMNLLSKSFGHSEGFTIGLVFLGFIFIPILGLGESKYVGPAGQPAAPPAA
jgi:hypothetical protein